MSRILAALMFFTRLPWWRLGQVATEHFKHVVDYWPFCGWITGGLMAAVYALAVQALPPTTAALMAIVARLLLTGALHEDGLADFFDGMGGGHTRERILAIMKDSHIGSYGVLALCAELLLLITLMPVLPHAPLCILTADVYAKVCASFIILQLPYARTEAQAKAGVVYVPWQGRHIATHLLRCAMALAPCIVWWATTAPSPWLALAWVVPPLTQLSLVALMRRKLQGYTGDCCGALFLLCEAGFYVATAAITTVITH